MSVVASIRSSRSRPGSSVASRNTIEQSQAVETGEVLDLIPTVKVATVSLTDRSTYHGEVNDDGVPDGVGVLLSVFGSTYSGGMKDGMKHGEGVELQSNGTTYSGEFRGGVANGYGVYVGTLGDKYIGQWEDGGRRGVGVSVDAESVITVSHFNTDEPVNGDSNLSWEEDVQPCVVRAVLAEKAGISSQEIARQRHIDAVLQEMTAIGSETFNTSEAIDAFEIKEELQTTQFIRNQSDQMNAVNSAAGELKFYEAQLTQRQKELRAEITAKTQELSFVSKYCAMAEARKTQVLEAERTLETLQRQLDVISSCDAGSASELELHVRTASRDEL
ncbi:Phosphatidylinositol 4-phosphate 5-kinase 4 [Phytophthora citrophthora]|uniref:Phosphatidylinositol 4-phosphate 5-kinase 4 n=1 Tax=Phytophthora citrophthora TaxID=4793 RepID=A0AAD9G481_9STRA|nr:Phosphatidylinositol 4-phosphate 5-kinase 4 [Phytophthora citrophthora]